MYGCRKGKDTIYIAVCVILFAAAFTMLSRGLRSLHAGQIQQNIAAQVIRLHVVANSDSEKDQALKLRVRDAVLQNLQDSLSSTKSVEEARNILQKQMSAVEDAAQKTIEEEGYTYPVKVTMQTRYFPVKTYGDLRFPAGNYQALCLEIGASRGHNWWCVLYPSLCFVDETYAVIPETSKKKLKKSLSAEEYSSLEVHSALYDWAKKKVAGHHKTKSPK
jgi:stage II sporulation protein R